MNKRSAAGAEGSPLGTASPSNTSSRTTACLPSVLPWICMQANPLRSLQLALRQRERALDVCSTLQQLKHETHLLCTTPRAPTVCTPSVSNRLPSGTWCTLGTSTSPPWSTKVWKDVFNGDSIFGIICGSGGGLAGQARPSVCSQRGRVIAKKAVCVSQVFCGKCFFCSP